MSVDDTNKHNLDLQRVHVFVSNEGTDRSLFIYEPGKSESEDEEDSEASKPWVTKTKLTDNDTELNDLVPKFMRGNFASITDYTVHTCTNDLDTLLKESEIFLDDKPMFSAIQPAGDKIDMLFRSIGKPTKLFTKDEREVVSSASGN